MSDTKNTITELQKMKMVKAESLTLTEFVDWLEQNNMRICKRVNSEYAPYEVIMESYERLFARFFDIDMNKVEKNKGSLIGDILSLLIKIPLFLIFVLPFLPGMFFLFIKFIIPVCIICYLFSSKKNNQATS